ncbi:nucleotidyltransferase family protein [uncultured Shimia sp.]|uniref:nucleotidyltransferase family protein n=1 Tax=uncultured Shimia sp. TaxID=573152 RepID=UPI002626E144|nr:nucleotidyltransferase family protein [uncultured Shimia sp.]
MLSILLLAAGSSSRMRGADKLMQDVDGNPLIRTMATRALDTGCPVRVTLPDAAHPRAKALADLDVTQAIVPDADMGMAHSIRAGVSALPATVTAVMILPADMPDLTASDLMKMHQAFTAAPEGALLRGVTSDNHAGHPVIFPQECFEALSQISGDQGARSVVKEFAGPVVHVPLPDHHALTDLDTPEDWAHWRNCQD